MCNGSTYDSDSYCLGSNPSSAATRSKRCTACSGFSFHGKIRNNPERAPPLLLRKRSRAARLADNRARRLRVWGNLSSCARGRLAAGTSSYGLGRDASACAGKTSEGGRGARRDGGRLRIRGEDFVSFPIHSVDRFSFFGYTAIDHSKGKLSANGTLRISPDCGIFLYWHTVLCFGELQQGYPSRVRGKHADSLNAARVGRITPARAGKNMWKASPAQVL